VIPPTKGTQKKPALKPNEIRLRTRKKPTGGGHYIEIQVGQQVAGRMSWRGDDAPVTLFWGVDKALGRLKIAPEQPDQPTWIVKPNKARTMWRLCTSALPETFVDEPLDEAVVFEIIPTAATEPAPFMVVTLPKGFHERGAW
jgi:hypothetical protein